MSIVTRRSSRFVRRPSFVGCLSFNILSVVRRLLFVIRRRVSVGVRHLWFIVRLPSFIVRRFPDMSLENEGFSEFLAQRFGSRYTGTARQFPAA